MIVTVQRLLAYFAITIVLLLSLLFVFIAFDGTAHSVTLPVHKITGTEDTLQQYPGAIITGPGEISMIEPGYIKEVLAPRKYVDSVYTIFFFLALILVIVFFRDFSYDNPFTHKALTGLKIGLWMMIALLILDAARHAWFDWQIRELTVNQYTYNVSAMRGGPDWWMLLLVIWLIGIFRRGLALQGETDLTI